jgi:adenylate cyclase
MKLFQGAASPTLAGIAAFAVALLIWGLAPNAIRSVARERAFDHLLPLLNRPAETRPDVVIVDIDRAALAKFGPWPWPRAQLARVVAAVAAGRPAVIGIDILLAGPDRFTPDGDALLAQSLSTTPSVLGFVLDTAPAGPDLPATPILSRRPLDLPGLWRSPALAGPTQTLADAAVGFGALVASPDADGEIRRLPLLVATGDVIRPGFAVETVLRAQDGNALLIDANGDASGDATGDASGDANGVLRIGEYTAPLGLDARLRLPSPPLHWLSHTISAVQLLDDPGLASSLSGRIVLIGATAPEIGGSRVTPASPATPEVWLQAEAIAAILRGGIAWRPYWADSGELTAAIVLATLGLLLAARRRPATATGLMLLLIAGWTVGTAAAAARLDLLIDPAGPPALAATAFIVASLTRFIRDEWLARRLRLSFEQHLAPEVVRRIAADPAALRLRGEMREITALFTDIEGFTSMTERAEPADLVALLDAYFEATTRVVTDHGGMIDKIVGDAIHAIFNAPFALDDHPGRAVACALKLLEVSETMRDTPAGQRLLLGRTRIGIETGLAIVGDVGGGRKLDYTAHGNAMNAAARLEAANKEFGSSICIGPGTAARLDPALLRPIGMLTPRGQSREVTVFTPVSLPAGPAPGSDQGDPGAAAPRTWRASRELSPEQCHRGGDSRRLPDRGRRRFHAWRGDVGAQSGGQAHGRVRANHEHRATFDEHAEHAIAGAGEESRAAYRHQTERRADRDVVRCVFPIMLIQHGTAIQSQGPSGVDDKSIDPQL